MKIEWIITDELTNVSKQEFDLEWNGIYGYFQMTINDKMVGCCPNRELIFDEEGNEDITYWLEELLQAKQMLEEGKEYKFNLLSLNLVGLEFSKRNSANVRMFYNETDETIWSEQIDFNKFGEEIVRSTNEFINIIREKNPSLLECNIIKKLIREKIMQGEEKRILLC